MSTLIALALNIYIYLFHINNCYQLSSPKQLSPTLLIFQVIQTITHTTYRMPKPAKAPEKLYAMMLKCWAAAPEERPTFETLTWQLRDFFKDETTEVSRSGLHLNQQENVI